MATLNLPYPNMDFVPLDILTAAEMNQMVANDQALATFANGLADGTNLSDGIVLTRHLAANAVSADNINFATIKRQQNIRSYTGNRSTGYNPMYYPNVVGTDIGGGLFTHTSDGKINALRRLRLSVAASIQVSTSGNSVFRAHLNGDADANEFIAAEGASSGFNMPNLAFDILLEAGDFVYLSAYTSIAGSVNPAHTKMLAVATEI